MLKGSVADRILLFEKMPEQLEEPRSQKSPPKEIIVCICVINDQINYNYNTYNNTNNNKYTPHHHTTNHVSSDNAAAIAL